MIHSSRPPEPITASDAPTTGPKIYHCGPLTYTSRGLVILFAWLLWGDFCFQLMETVVSSILPLKLKSLSASNTTISMFLTTLPGVLNVAFCPWISSASDRHRSKWGRRIPFILWTMPLLTVSMVLLAWSERLGPMLQGMIPKLAAVAPATVIIAVIGVFMTAFSFFNVFVNSVFWYLFNDVVPPQFLGRFMGLFRIVSSGVIALYQFFVFRYAEKQMHWILTGAAVLYLVGFGLMCLRVKEGKYPPPPEDEAGEGILPAIGTFAKQSFSARFYWYFYLTQVFAQTSYAYVMFYVFFYRNMGLTDGQIGKLNGWGYVAGLVATWFTAVFVDRWHPLRVRTYLSVFSAVTGFGGWIWLAVTLPGDVFFWVTLGTVLVTRFGATLGEAAEIPLFMRLMPKSLYGQFSSANGMLRTLFGWVLGGLLCGMCIDGLSKYYNGSDFAYRWLFAWPWVFGIGSTIFLCLGYREWKRLGGDEDYRPPAPWRPEGFEEVADKVKSSPARPGMVIVALWLGVAAVLVNVLLVLVFMYFMHKYGLNRSLHWYAWMFIPVELALTAIAYWQLVHVQRDIKAQERGETTRYGVPHHGVIMINAVQGLVYFPVLWYQTVAMIHLGLDRELILFGIANLLTTAGSILGTQIVRWIERPVVVVDRAGPQAQPAGGRAFPALSAASEAGAEATDPTWPPR